MPWTMNADAVDAALDTIARYPDADFTEWEIGFVDGVRAKREAGGSIDQADEQILLNIAAARPEFESARVGTGATVWGAHKETDRDRHREMGKKWVQHRKGRA